jgi:hypothetical protein
MVRGKKSFFATGMFMKILPLFLMAVCLAVFPAVAAPAQDQGAAAAPAEKVEIIPDQDAGTVTIVIDGRPVVTIDADGVHVTGDITYTGAARDTEGHAQ